MEHGTWSSASRQSPAARRQPAANNSGVTVRASASSRLARQCGRHASESAPQIHHCHPPWRVREISRRLAEYRLKLSPASCWCIALALLVEGTRSGTDSPTHSQQPGQDPGQEPGQRSCAVRCGQVPGVVDGRRPAASLSPSLSGQQDLALLFE